MADAPSRLRNCVFVLPSFAGGGAERVMLQMAMELPRYRIDTELWVLNPVGPLRLAVAPEVSVVEFGSLRLRDAIAGLARRVRKNQPEMLFSSFGHVTAALVAITAPMRCRPRLIAREPNLPSLSMAGRGINRWLRLACRVAYPRCDLVVASSQRMASELVQDYHVRPDRLFVLPNPVDEAGIRQRALDRPTPPACGRLFVAAGRLVQQKGFDRLIDLWPETRDDDVLVLLGEGPERGRLEAAARRSGVGQRVLFMGYQENPWGWYALADALLMPSRFEGMPNVALEALACGTPVLATPESGGLIELAPWVPERGLRIAPAAEFARTIAEVERACRPGPRPSLLPGRFRLDTVAVALARRLRALLP